MTQALAALSQSLGQVTAAAGPMLSAIRVGPNRHVTGLICEGDRIVTTDQALPAYASYTVAMPNRTIASARPGQRDPAANLAVLHLDTPWPTANPQIAAVAVGNLVVIVGTDIDASPTVRLAVVHRLLRSADGPVPVLDIAADAIDPGGLVMDSQCRLVGLAAVSPSGEAMVIPSGVVGRMLMPDQSVIPPPAAVPVMAAADPHRRGWLGVALQPITVPDHMAVRAGQKSGRMVVSLTRGGPAEMAGMRVGDVLLSLNGASATGPQALRALLGSERVGTTVEIKLLRDGALLSTHLTIAAQPS